MAKALQFKLVVPSGTVFEGEIEEVQLGTLAGPITVLADHMPMVTPVKTGVLVIRTSDGAVDHYAVGDGILSINSHGATMAAEAAEHADTIAEIEAKKAVEEAREKLSKVLTDEEVAFTEGTIARNIARVEAYQRHKRYHTRH